MMTGSALSDAERMDRHYQYQRFIYDLTRTHYLIGRKHLIADLQPCTGARVLEIGCGTAWNLVRVAKRYPGAEVFGIDVSNAMLDTARSSVKRHGLAGKIHFAQADATAFSGRQSFGVPEFDRVFFSYALSMIPGWRDALSAGVAHLAPGGRMHIVDFGQCEKLPNSFKMVFFNFLGHYSVTPRADLEQVCMRVCEEQSLSLSFRRLHRGYTDYAVLNRSTR